LASECKCSAVVVVVAEKAVAVAVVLDRPVLLVVTVFRPQPIPNRKRAAVTAVVPEAAGTTFLFRPNTGIRF
jgi:hypothetical protein